MSLEKTHDFFAPVERIRTLAAVRVLRRIDCSASWSAMPAAARHFVTMLSVAEMSPQ
jgi:hypothetical protein